MPANAAFWGLLPSALPAVDSRKGNAEPCRELHLSQLEVRPDCPEHVPTPLVFVMFVMFALSQKAVKSKPSGAVLAELTLLTRTPADELKPQLLLAASAASLVQQSAPGTAQVACSASPAQARAGPRR